MPKAIPETSQPKLDVRAARVVQAGCLLFGERWQRRMAEASGLSHQLVSCIASGAKPVTDAVERKIAAALSAEIARLGKTATALQVIHRAMLK